MALAAAVSLTAGNLIAIFVGILGLVGVLVAALVNVLNSRISESTQQLSRQLDQVQRTLDNQSERIQTLSDKLADTSARTTASIDQLDRRVERLE